MTPSSSTDTGRGVDGTTRTIEGLNAFTIGWTVLALVTLLIVQR